MSARPWVARLRVPGPHHLDVDRDSATKVRLVCACGRYESPWLSDVRTALQHHDATHGPDVCPECDSVEGEHPDWCSYLERVAR